MAKQTVCPPFAQLLRDHLEPLGVILVRALHHFRKIGKNHFQKRIPGAKPANPVADAHLGVQCQDAYILIPRWV
jgi:hypothetical protein